MFYIFIHGMEIPYSTISNCQIVLFCLLVNWPYTYKSSLIYKIFIQKKLKMFYIPMLPFTALLYKFMTYIPISFIQGCYYTFYAS